MRVSGETAAPPPGRACGPDLELTLPATPTAPQPHSPAAATRTASICSLSAASAVVTQTVTNAATCPGAGYTRAMRAALIALFTILSLACSSPAAVQQTPSFLQHCPLPG